MGRFVATLAMAVSLVGVMPSPARARPSSDGGSISATDVVTLTRSAQPVALSNVVIQGDLDLRPVGTVSRPFRCLRCRFGGGFRASDVVFERLFDVTGSYFGAGVDLDGALFEERATFDASQFAGAVAVVSARFSTDVSFSGVQFLFPATFDRLQTGGTASFAKSEFVDDASFAGAHFAGKSDFGRAMFKSTSMFRDTVFTGRVSFLHAAFTKQADFRGSELPGGANLRLLTLEEGALFDQVSAGGAVDLEGSLLRGEVAFGNMGTSGSLSLTGVRPRRAQLYMDGIAVHDLVMDIRHIDVVQGPKVQKQVLGMIERSAKERQDLSLANEARFRLLSLEAQEHKSTHPVSYALDRIFYRDIAGYLVRPAHPLLAFLALLAAGGLARGLRNLPKLRVGARPSTGTQQPDRRRGVVQRLRLLFLGQQKAVATVLSGIASAFFVAFRRKAEIKVEDPDRVRAYFCAMALWSEFLAYKVLIAVFLLALGNSNATVRQLFDAVRS